MMLDRRSLLAAGAAGATALAAGACPPRPRPRAIRKALKYGMIQEGSSLADRFQVARDVGFDGVELDSPNDFDPEEVLRAKERAGIEIPGVVDSVHWRKTLGDPDPEVRAAGVAALETALRDCRTYGGTTVLLVPGVVRDAVPYHLVYERSQAEIRKVLPLAAELDVAIAIENVWNSFLLSPVEAARYVDELGGEHVGWYFDVGNVVRYGFPHHWVRALGERILKLDVKGYSEAERFDAPIGDDDCGWPKVMAALDEVGFSGWASAEVRGGKRARLEEILRRMTAVLES